MVVINTDVEISYTTNIDSIVISGNANTDINIINSINNKLRILVELYNLCDEKAKHIYDNDYINIENEFNNKIRAYQDKINLLKEEYKEEYDREFINKQNLLKLEYESKLNLERYKIEEKMSEINTLKINNERLFTDILSKIGNMDNIQKGIIGEAKVYNFINEKIKINPEWSIENVSKDGNNSSDLSVIYKNLKCVIEVKNIKTNISNCVVKKFNEVYITNDDRGYNCGIFISLKSAYGIGTGLHDFYIKTINNKYVIYLAETELNLDKIIIALDTLNYLIKKNNNDKNISEITELLSLQVNNYNALTTDINKAAGALKSSLKNIAQFKDAIYNILDTDDNKKYEIRDNKYWCNECSKNYISKNSVINHITKTH